MRPLTDGQFWCGMIVLMLFFVTIIIGFLAHWKSISNDILKEDRRRLSAWAMKYAEQRAHELLREYVASIRIEVPVKLINESDISWGADSRRDDAA